MGARLVSENSLRFLDGVTRICWVFFMLRLLRYFFPSLFSILVFNSSTGFDIPKTNCNTPLGMESGQIPDSALAASSRFNQFRGPERGRLFMQNKGNAFSSRF